MNTNTVSVEVVRQEGLKFRASQRQKSAETAEEAQRTRKKKQDEPFQSYPEARFERQEKIKGEKMKHHPAGLLPA